jgi:hypothetical protein
MASAAQTLANQANAQRSTGPRTASGKSRSSQNARTHGLTGSQPTVAPNQQSEFAALAADLEQELAPAGALEQILFEQILHAAWNLRTCHRLQLALATTSPADPAVERLALYTRRAERSFYRGLNELRALQTEAHHRQLSQTAAPSTLTDTFRLHRNAHRYTGNSPAPPANPTPAASEPTPHLRP